MINEQNNRKPVAWADMMRPCADNIEEIQIDEIFSFDVVDGQFSGSESERTERFPLELAHGQG